jgi:hypothetical protein
MYIHFLYVESKEYKNNYVVTIKDEKNILDNNLINKLLYKYIYLNNDNSINNNINYISLFYIKKGLILDDKNNYWNDLFKIYLKEIKLIDLIDNNSIKKIQNNNLLLFNIDLYKDQLSNFIINIYLD